MKKRTLHRNGLTLIELMVVIAIIAILAAVLMGTFSGGTESARAAKCLSNMRNLAAACQSYGVESGHYPTAGSFEKVDIDLDDAKTRMTYSEVTGWIGWNSRDAYKKDSNGHGPSTHKASASWNLSTYSEDDESTRFCLTNGVLWKYVSGNRGIYVCPQHSSAATTLQPKWSYVMNAYFRWDHTKGKRAMPSDGDDIYRWYGKLRRADRRLLFAEIPFSGIGVEAVFEESGERCDSVLQYKGCLGCGEAEVIGFNHKSGKRNTFAHVCFADGHTEKLSYPPEMSESQLKELTKWLCEGTDISFDGKEYREIKN